VQESNGAAAEKSSMFAYVGSFTTAQRKARGDGIHVYRADPATGSFTPVQHIGDLVNRRSSL
jgi:6-phosphogluconolactonase